MKWSTLAFACLVLSPPASAQLHSGPGKDFWWDDAPPTKEVAPPLIPDHWLIIPTGSGTTPSQVFRKHLLHPQAVQPAVKATEGEGLPWKPVETSHPLGALIAYTRIVSERAEVRMADLRGAETLFVNGEAFAGDPDRRQFLGVPIALKPGDNHLFVFGIRDSFDLQLWCPPTRMVIADWDLHWSDGFSLIEDLCPVFNASTEAVETLHVHYGHGTLEDSSHKLSVTAWSDAGTMLPLGLRVEGRLVLDDDPQELQGKPLVMPISVYSSGDQRPDQRILRCPAQSRSGSASSRPDESRAVMRGTLLQDLNAPCVFVIGGGEAMPRARFDQQRLWYQSRIVPEIIHDAECTNFRVHFPSSLPWKIQEPLRRGPIVVYGNAASNKAWSSVLPVDFPPDGAEFDVRADFLFVNGQSFHGDDICGWIAFRESDGTPSAIAMADTGTRGARLGYLVQPLFAKADGLDYCFWDSRGENGAPRVIASGTFAKKNPGASGR